MAYKKRGSGKPNFKSNNNKKSGGRNSGGGSGQGAFGQWMNDLAKSGRPAKRQTNKNHGTNKRGGGQQG